MFIHHAKQLVCLIYVDDCVWYHRDSKVIEAMVEDIKKDLDLNFEDNVAGFLDIQIDPR